MSETNFSRRKFLQGVATTSTGAALAAWPATATGLAPGTSVADPPTPVTVESYPIVEPGKGAALDHLKIVTLDDIPGAHGEKILGLSPHIALRRCGSAGEFHREVADAHVIYGEFSRQDLLAAKELKWIQWTAAGVENILSPELVESPVVLTNMQRIYAPVISETVMAFLLALNRHLHEYTFQTRDHVWKQVPGLNEISGSTMGLVGLGGIGTATAYRAHYGFGMKILAVDPKPLPKPGFVEELHSLDYLPTLASRVDVLVSAAPHTPLSEKMFNESIFHAMKPSAYFINVSRGKLVDTPALIRALKEGWISGAALDVAYKEPLPADDPLWTAPNIIITSHSSAVSPKVADRMMELFGENVRRYIAGLPLLNVVDKRRGY